MSAPLRRVDETASTYLEISVPNGQDRRGGDRGAGASRRRGISFAVAHSGLSTVGYALAAGRRRGGIAPGTADTGRAGRRG